jgi:hypothetical protein
MTAAAGTVAMVYAWYQTTQTISVERQARWATAGLVGLAATCLAMLFAVLAARRAVATRVSAAAGPLTHRRPAPAAGAGSAPAEWLVAAPGMARFHRASCPMASGKPVRPASRSEHEATGRRPCGMCEP